MKLKLAVLGLAALGSAALVSSGASAMPNGLPGASDTVKNIEHVLLLPLKITKSMTSFD